MLYMLYSTPLKYFWKIYMKKKIHMTKIHGSNAHNRDMFVKCFKKILKKCFTDTTCIVMYICNSFRFSLIKIWYEQ